MLCYRNSPIFHENESNLQIFYTNESKFADLKKCLNLQICDKFLKKFSLKYVKKFAYYAISTLPDYLLTDYLLRHVFLMFLKMGANLN